VLAACLGFPLTLRCHLER